MALGFLLQFVTILLKDLDSKKVMKERKASVLLYSDISFSALSLGQFSIYIFKDYKHHQMLFKSLPEVDFVISNRRRTRDAEFPVRELHYEVLFKSILKTTHKKTAPLPTTEVFNSNNASFTCSKKADSMSKDAETTALVFMELPLKTVIKFYKFNWVHPDIEK